MLTRDQMLQCLQLAHTANESQSLVVQRAEAYAAFVAKGGHGSFVDQRLNCHGVKQEEAKPVEVASIVQDATFDAPKQVEQPAPAAPRPAGKTHDDCKKAFVAYLGKGGGRCAAKFVNEIMTPKYGVKNITQVPADRLDELHADLEAA